MNSLNIEKGEKNLKQLALSPTNLDAFIDTHYKFLERLYFCKEKVYQLEKSSSDDQPEKIGEYKQEAKKWVELLKKLVKLDRHLFGRMNKARFTKSCKEHLEYFKNKYNH